MSCLLVSDIHGCWFTLVRLLNKAPRGCKLVFLGDLIDRGPHSRKVVEFAMEHSIPTVLGNHESMALAFYEDEGYRKAARCAEMYDRGVWLNNGGDAAAANWPTIDKRAIHWRRDQHAGGRVPNEVLDWMAALPAYLYPSDELDNNGRRLLASHTGYGLDADINSWFRTIWGRRGYDSGAWREDPITGEEVDDKLFRVYGHTPAKQVLITDREAMIDTGAAYSSRGGGLLSALLWPSKTILDQRYDESPVEPTFSIANQCIVDRSA